jgi:hypothetical protein
MIIRMLAALALIAVPAAASAMPVSTFLAKAEALKKKGPLALFSGDLKLLTGQVKKDAAALGAENKASAAANRPKAYCTPASGAAMGQKEVLEAMQAVPAPERATTDTKAALRAWLARRYPCPAG